MFRRYWPFLPEAMMMAHAERVYVLADASKLGRRPFHAWARMPPSWTLVTDDGAPPDEVERVRAAGVDVIVTRTEVAAAV